MPLNMVEYQIKNKPNGLEELKTHTGYGYLMAKDGIYLRVNTDIVEAVLTLARVPVRGLFEQKAYVQLKVPKIPAVLLESFLWEAKNAAKAGNKREIYGIIRYLNGEYQLNYPKQEATETSVTAFRTVEQQENVVCVIHSHNTMNAFHSPIDDHSEQDHAFYVTVGKVLSKMPEISVRLGVHGYYQHMSYTELFEGVEGLVKDVGSELAALYRVQDELSESESPAREGENDSDLKKPPKLSLVRRLLFLAGGDDDGR